MNDAKFILFTLVLARVGGLTMTAPIYGTNDVPLRVRIVLAASLALLIVPSQWGATTHDLGQVFLAGAFGNYINHASAPAWALAS